MSVSLTTLHGEIEAANTADDVLKVMERDWWTYTCIPIAFREAAMIAKATKVLRIQCPSRLPCGVSWPHPVLGLM